MDHTSSPEYSAPQHLKIISRLIGNVWEPQKISRSRFVGFLVLTAIAYLGNYYKYPIAFGLDFLFGSIAVILVLKWYPRPWGLITAVVAATCTFVLWNHPWAMVGLILEAIFLCRFTCKTQRNLVIGDILYWALVGAPLMGYCYHNFLGFSLSSSLLVMLKQSLNGIFNAIIASLILVYLPQIKPLSSLGKRLGLVSSSSLKEDKGAPGLASKFSFQLIIFNILAIFILAPLLLQMVTSINYELRRVDQEVESVLIDRSIGTENDLKTWYSRTRKSMETLAELVQEYPDRDRLSHELLHFDRLSDAITYTSVYYKDGDQLSVDLRTQELVRGRWNPNTPDPVIDSFLYSGLSYSPEATVTNLWKAVKSIRQTVNTAVVQDQETGNLLFYAASPIILRGSLDIQGMIVGLVDMTNVTQILETNTSRYPLVLNLLDSKSRYVASSNPKIPLLTLHSFSTEGTEKPMGNQGVYQWLPKVAKSPMLRWRNSFYVMRRPLGKPTNLDSHSIPAIDLPWTLQLELSPQSYISNLESFQIWNLSLMLLLLGLALPVAALTSRRMVRPIFSLAKTTTDVPQKIWDGTEIPWPRTSITEISLLSQNFQAMAAVLQHQFQEVHTAKSNLSSFLANMSHELRTPLNAILGFTQVLSRNINPPPDPLPDRFFENQWETLAIIRRSGEHLLALINDVLDISKIEAGRVTLLDIPFDLHTLLLSLMDIVKIRAQAKNLHLSYECDPQVPLGIQGDERKLRQVLINLLSNAIKFTESGSVTLRVKAESCPGEEMLDHHPQDVDQAPKEPQKMLITFQVEDTGAGIAEEDLEGLFEAFTQTEVGRHSEEGTGLGLPISRKFVQLMGGDLEVTSTPGVGSCFYFTIPVTVTSLDRSVQLAKNTPVIGIAPNQPTYCILLVDDVTENRTLLRQLLEPVGFDVLEASNGQEAIEVWQQHHPDLIFMDMRMPVMGGYEATCEIRAQSDQPQPVIVALTASVFDEERAKILAGGCDDFLHKPITEEELFRQLTQHLGVTYTYGQVPNGGSTIGSQGVGSGEFDRPGNSLTDLKPADLATQPQAWVAQLNLAARGAEDEMVWQLLDQIPPQQSALAEALAELVNEFRLDKIVSLTEAVPTVLRRHRVVEMAEHQQDYRILVVDDRPENRRLLLTLLEPLGFILEEAANGQEAIALWETFQPHLILMDLQMPLMNGYQATQWIKSQPLGHDTVIIALTASIATDSKTPLLEAGFHDILRKPFAESQLLEVLAQYLGIQYTSQEIYPSFS